METFYSNGKLLLTGEYVVLDGALALALPTKLGQSLTIEPLNKPLIQWKSIDCNNSTWFEDTFFIKKAKVYLKKENDNAVAKRLLQIFKAIEQLNPNFFNTSTGYSITSKLDFPQNWGLGSSSTLINNIAQWTTINAFDLLKLTFGGSGYDIACASHNSPITYQIKESKIEIKDVNFTPSFLDHLFFIHLNKKQNSREGITHYNTNKGNCINEINEISLISSKILACTSLSDFESLLFTHETIIANITQQETVKNRLFKDYKGQIKSLGAWGGDFIMATGSLEDMSYFKDKGYTSILPYKDLIL